ncbi:hypothetical protein [Antrihabitans cavernicola]|uniref:hypothetical protein n=1 Tax=Antrihabitans cavernicola TaxID=2495913 RepID=UPI00165915F3|nr:hypothetical protein [Spelaeibacter cavernicola]
MPIGIDIAIELATRQDPWNVARMEHFRADPHPHDSCGCVSRRRRSETHARLEPRIHRRLDPSDGPADVGTKFVGWNRQRYLWFTTCKVVTAEPNKEFAFEVTSFGLPIAKWGYRFDQHGDCAVAQVSV